MIGCGGKCGAGRNCAPQMSCCDGVWIVLEAGGETRQERFSSPGQNPNTQTLPSHEESHEGFYMYVY